MQEVQISDNQARYQLLLQLKEELAAFQVVSCRLKHEQVRELFEDTITEDADLEELQVRRQGLCKTDTRRKFLGCAHTIANETFAKLANRVYDTGVLMLGAEPGTVVKELCLQIYLVDHEMGFLEKRKALAQHQGHAEQVTEIEDTMQKALVRYQVARDELELLRSDIVRGLDEAIVQYQVATQ